MKLSQTGMGTVKLNNIDEMYPGQSILLQTGQLVQYGAGIFGYNTIPLLVKKKIESIIEETLNKYVGHFIETPIEEGNIALAGHNRGYDVNYFSRLKELREGDEIIYIHNEINRIYEVTKNKIIKDTDIDVLENTEENILTLITCVENEPNYRRCVQAEEKNLNYNY